MNATIKQRFKVVPFTNPRTGSISWRVTGRKRDGTRVRENFRDEHSAKCRHVELEAEYLKRETETTIRSTKLTDVQLRLAELAFARLDDDADLPRAVDYWLQHGRQNAIAGESPRIDDAVKQFAAWLDDEPTANGNGRCTLREHSRKGLKVRVGIFANSIGNSRVNQITPDTVENFLNKLQDVSPVTRDNYRRAISRFFSWCIQRPRRWTMLNPCKEIRIEKDEKGPPAILSVQQCRDMLKAAEREGLAPYVALGVFGGLRPFEISRLTWQAINLKDREIRLEGPQTKTGKPRVVSICDTLAAWLKAYKDEPIFPSNWRRRFDRVQAAAGYGTPTKKRPDLKPWPVDVMRHTAISHYFRKTGSYGQTAEQFGNSEAIIKNHYQGRVSSEDTAKFYAIRPAKKGAK